MDRIGLKYLACQAHTRPVTWQSPPADMLNAIVVIPAFEEAATLPVTLARLADCPLPAGVHAAIIVVVNNPAANPGNAESCRAFADNQATLRWLRESAPRLPLPLGWIDASSPGYELNGRGGVGQARRIGCDTALQLMAHDHEPPSASRDDATVILNLDADTLTEPTYWAVVPELIDSRKGGGSIRFAHQPAATPDQQHAIDSYELYLHHYVEGLRLAGSPYAFHSVGSAMACTTRAYVSAGGMPRKRLAGEDFYFMQNLAKTSGVSELSATVVHPSARPSHRVVFGTGARVASYLSGEETRFTVFSLAAFSLLRSARTAICQALVQGVPALRALPQHVPPEIAALFAEAGLERVAEGFQRQFATPQQRITAFDTWFDGLATFRLLRRLSESLVPPVPLLQGWRDLLAELALDLPADTPANLLQAWRHHLEGKTCARITAPAHSLE